jgi:hypothetical protein
VTGWNDASHTEACMAGKLVATNNGASLYYAIGVRELAASLAELAPLTLAATKEATRRMLAALTPHALDDLILSCYLSRDFHEGVRAFLERRKPDWQGR